MLGLAFYSDVENISIISSFQ